MRVASRASSARSWVTNRTPPRNSSSWSSSHWITSTSRWLVGSSRSSRSGSPTSACASATRRRQPPESAPSGVSAGSSSRARIWSTRWLTLQPPRTSSSCCSASMRASCAASSPAACDTRWNSARSPPSSASPPATTSKTVAASSEGGSCASVAIFKPGMRQTAPASGVTSPLTILSKVDLPAPLRPIRHTRSPASTCRLAPSRSACGPNAIDTPSRLRSGIAPLPAAAPAARRRPVRAGAPRAPPDPARGRPRSSGGGAA